MLAVRRLSHACARVARTNSSAWRGFAAAASEGADAQEKKSDEQEQQQQQQGGVEAGDVEQETSADNDGTDGGDSNAEGEIEELQKKVDSLQQKYMESLAEMENVR